MSIKKFRLNRKNSSGSYDTIHYETSSNIVMRPDGSTVEESLINNNLPSGVVVMWSGSSDDIPTGWLLCDGNNNTPDLRNRFIVGAGSSYSVGATGGSDTVTLSINQIPSHSHDFSLSALASGSHTHTCNGVVSSAQSGGYATQSARGGTVTTSSSGEHTHAVSGSISNTGGGQSHENRPPYYALCFIMKI